MNRATQIILIWITFGITVMVMGAGIKAQVRRGQESYGRKRRKKPDENYLVTGMSFGICLGVAFGCVLMRVLGPEILFFGLCFGMMGGMIIGRNLKKKPETKTERKAGRLPPENRIEKYIFGKSLVRSDLTVHLPPQAVEEYRMASEGRVYLFTGSRSTGGFCVTRKGLLLPSDLRNILNDNPDLRDYVLPEGMFVACQGRSYCWSNISKTGVLTLTREMFRLLEIQPGMELLCIRSSDLAFTMGVRGPLLETANYQSEVCGEDIALY